MHFKLFAVMGVLAVYSFCVPDTQNTATTNSPTTKPTAMQPTTQPQGQVVRAIKHQNGIPKTLNLQQQFADTIAGIALQLITHAEPLRMHLDEEAMTALRQNLTGIELFFAPPIGNQPDESGVSKLLFLQAGQFANTTQTPDARLFIALADGQYIQSPYVAEGKARLVEAIDALLTQAAR